MNSGSLPFRLCDLVWAQAICDLLTGPDYLDADQLAALDAHPLHERNIGAGIEWGGGR